MSAHFQAPVDRNFLSVSDVLSGATAYVAQKLRGKSNRNAMEWFARATLYSTLGKQVEARSDFLKTVSPIQLQYLSSGAMSVLADMLMSAPVSEQAENALVSIGSNWAGDYLTGMLGQDYRLI